MTIVQRLRCTDCSYESSPVGLRPFSPTSAINQRFFRCESCKELVVADATADGRDVRCSHCGQGGVLPLNQCPKCGGPRYRWG